MRGWLLTLILLSAIASAGTLPDPMRPAQRHAHLARHAQASVPVVSAVLIRKDATGKRGAQRKAIVDGRWVKPGDRVGRGRIQSITNDGVQWVHRGKVRDLRLSSAAISLKKLTADPPRVDTGVP
jgi:hypothetical protein